MKRKIDYTCQECLSKIPERIRDLRKQKGWSQETLGKKLGINFRTVSKIENGDCTISTDILLNCSLIFDVSLDYLCFKDVVSQQENEFKEKYNQLSDKRKEVIINVIDSYNDETPKSSTTSGKKLR